MGGPKLEFMLPVYYKLEFMLPEYYNNIMQSDYVEKKSVLSKLGSIDNCFPK